MGRKTWDKRAILTITVKCLAQRGGRYGNGIESIENQKCWTRGKFGPIFLASEDRWNGVEPGQLFLGYLREYPRALEESRDQRAA